MGSGSAVRAAWGAMAEGPGAATTRWSAGWDSSALWGGSMVPGMGGCWPPGVTVMAQVRAVSWLGSVEMILSISGRDRRRPSGPALKPAACPGLVAEVLRAELTL